MTRGRGRERLRRKTTTGGTAIRGTLITGKRADTTTGRKSANAATTERGVGTTDTQTTAMVRRGKRGTTAMITAAVIRTDTDIDGTLIMRTDGEVQKTVNYVWGFLKPC